MSYCLKELGHLERESDRMTVSQTPLVGLYCALLSVSHRHHDVHFAGPAFSWGVAVGGETGRSSLGGYPLCLWSGRPVTLFTITAAGLELYLWWFLSPPAPPAQSRGRSCWPFTFPSVREALKVSTPFCSPAYAFGKIDTCRNIIQILYKQLH